MATHPAPPHPMPTDDAPLLAEWPLAAPVRAAFTGAAGVPAVAPEPVPDWPGWVLHGDPWGGITLLEHRAGGPPLRWAYRDRRGTLHQVLAWAHEPGGPRLTEARLRLPGGGWLHLRPHAAAHPLWGPCDTVAAVGGRTVRLPAQSYAALAHLPPLDAPAHLPAGGGSVLLNLLAHLLMDQGRASVAYRGPYPTPALFEALSTCFDPDSPPTDARERFSAGMEAAAFTGRLVANPVAWRPRPWWPLAPAPDVLVQGTARGVDAAWVQGVPFRQEAPIQRLWRDDAQGDGTWCAGLTLLGAPWHTALVGDAAGNALRQAPPAGEAWDAPLGDPWWPAVVAWATHHAHPALAAATEALATGASGAWAPLGLRAAQWRDAVLVLNGGWPEQVRRLSPDRPWRELALMWTSDVLQTAAPLLWRRAQSALEEATPAARNALLADGARARQRAESALQAHLPQLVQSLALDIGCHR